MLWARVRPGYDPYGWLVWGHLTLHGALDTNGAPSWKPLPYLFTLPYSLVGRHAVQLWMITAFALSLSGLVFAWRLAAKLINAPPGRRYAAHLAGLVAALGLLGIANYPHSILSSESDTIVTALLLAGADRLLARRYRTAFWIWWLAALGRPEAWFPFGLYALWAWRHEPALRRELVAGIALLPVAWFSVPALTSRGIFHGGVLAQNSVHAVHGNKLTGVTVRFLGMGARPVMVLAGLGVLLAIWRRDRPVLLLTGVSALWVAIEIAFALHGWSAVPRYMYEAAAGAAILAGVFLGRVVLDARAVLPRLGRVAAFRRLPLARPALAGWVSALVVLVFAGTCVPVAHGRIHTEALDLGKQRVRTVYVNNLAAAVLHLTPQRILACGQPNITIGWQSILAFDMGMNVGDLFFTPQGEKAHPRPVVVIVADPQGWTFQGKGWTNPAQAARCRGLRYQS
jgi:hypothetical protein